MYNIRRARTDMPGASDYSDAEDGGAIVIQKRLTRQIDEGVYNIKLDDYTETGSLANQESELSDSNEDLAGDGIFHSKSGAIKVDKLDSYSSPLDKSRTQVDDDVKS